jgi:hypothetical protein
MTCEALTYAVVVSLTLALLTPLALGLTQLVQDIGSDLQARPEARMVYESPGR